MKQLIIFKQNNCRPCDTLANILKYDLEVEADRTINLSEPKDGDIELATQYEIMSTPVVMLIDENGVATHKISGLAPREHYEEIFKQRGLL